MKVAPGEERSAEAISLELLRMAASSPRSACDRQEMVRLIEEFASALGVRDLASALNKSAAPAPDASSPEFETVYEIGSCEPSRISVISFAAISIDAH